MQAMTTSRSGRSTPRMRPSIPWSRIWKKSKKELKDEDYNSFYTQKFYDYQRRCATSIPAWKVR